MINGEIDKSNQRVIPIEFETTIGDDLEVTVEADYYVLPPQEGGKIVVDINHILIDGKDIYMCLGLSTIAVMKAEVRNKVEASL